jgi:hypothetical protein
MDLIDIARVSLPLEWHAYDRPNGRVYVRPRDLERAGGTLEWVSTYLWLGVVDTSGDAPQRTIERIMRRRVPQGEPTVFSVQLFGRDSPAYDYTNGVQLIQTCFFVLAGPILEFEAAARFLPSGAPEEDVPHLLNTLIESVQLT